MHTGSVARVPFSSPGTSVQCCRRHGLARRAHIAFRASSLRSPLPRKWKTQASAGPQAQPEKAAGAIALGLQAYEKEDYGEAISLFKKALDLPGTGLKQYRDKPAIASDGEKISAYYNIACCLSRTGNTHDGLLALLEALQMGYEDYQQLRTDPDLEGLRADNKFEPLLQKFQKVSRKGILQDFMSNLRNPLQK